MRCPSPRLALAAGAALTLPLVACGDDAGKPAATQPAGATCELLSQSAVQTVMPGAELDTSFVTPGSCTYYADQGDLIVSAYAGAPPGNAPPGTGDGGGDVYAESLTDATENGAKEVRAAPGLGEDGKLAINTADAELTAVWRRDGAVYTLQYSSWPGDPAEAARDLERLAAAVKAPR